MRMVAHVVGALAGGYPGGRRPARAAMSLRGSRVGTSLGSSDPGRKRGKLPRNRPPDGRDQPVVGMH